MTADSRSRSLGVIELGLSGYGYWGNLLRILNNNNALNVVAVADPKEARRVEVCRCSMYLRAVGISEDVISMPEIEA